MTSQKRVVRDVANAIAAHGTIGGRNPISTICDKTSNSSVAGKAAVEQALSKLADEGKIVVDRDNVGMITQVSHVRRQRAHRDRTEWSAQAKREHTFAKGVPAYLSDSQCSPVVTRSVNTVDLRDTLAASGNTDERELVVEFRYIKGSPYHQTLTMCLKVLRLHADETGFAANTSVRKTLLTIRNMSNGQVARAMDHLKGMGLYDTQMTGFQTSSYTVDTGVKEVTTAMVAEFRQLQSGSKQTQESSAPDEPVQIVESDDPMSRLATIIEQQECQIAELNAALIDLDDRLGDTSRRERESNLVIAQLNEQRDRLSEENDDLRKQVLDLSAQLQRRPAHDPRVAAILERHKQA